ncbi:MAG: serine/threonine protein kinase [Verrucomicrobia bacterium]|nr:serine/threonine protein kinase [Verrucomicrobiota bacterium]
MIGFGRYNLLLTIGRGGMGSVYLARQKTLRRFCAVKVINPQYSQEQDAAGRFLREARAAASLSHPNLVGIFDCDRHEGQYFIAMEYVEGFSLTQILRKHGPLPLPLSLYWLQQAAVGLRYIHSKGVVHRDIKPDNMIIDASGLLKIMDLGLAKHHFEGDQSMTATGTVMGSPHYMSPEQINDSKTVDHRTDIYSLGISLYQMLVGRVPFPHTSATAVCVAHLQEPIPSVALPDAAVTQTLDELIGRMSAKDVNQRVQSADELLATLETWIANNPTNTATHEFFSRIDFAERKVGQLLEKERLDPSTLDTDLPSNVPIPPSPASAGPADAPPAAGKPRRFLRWIVLMVAILLVIGIGRGIHKKKARPPPQTTTAQRTNSNPPSTAPVMPQPPKAGGLYVETRPDNAAVMFRADTQKSPATFNNVPVGRYVVKASMPGHRMVERELEIVENEVKGLKIELPEISAKRVIESSPSGAEVVANGRIVGTTPFTAEGLDGENREYVLRLAGCYNACIVVQLAETGGVQRVTLNPKPKLPDTAQLPPHPPSSPAVDSSPDLSKRQRRRHAMEKILEVTRQTPTPEWSDRKKKLLKQVEHLLQLEGANNPDAVRFAIENVGAILGEARAMTVSDFEAQKQRIMREIARSLERTIPPGNAPTSDAPR